MNVERRLDALAQELDAKKRALAISSEQLAFLRDVADEAKTNKLVSETPLADREHQEAQRDLDLHLKNHSRLGEDIAALERERDDLLDRLIPPPPA